MKFCNKCQQIKDDSDFYKRVDERKTSWCSACMVEYNHRWYLANREKHLAYVASHRPKAIPKRPHLCKGCGKGEPEVTFYIRKVGSRFYRRFLCYGCDNEYRKKYQTTEAAEKRERERKSAKARIGRQSPERRFLYILGDSRRSDKRHGRVNDLDWEFIRDKISNGCAYCGDTHGKMTLDRMDNSIGHTKHNVVASCLLCNLFRRDMPFDAWLIVAPALRNARDLGLLKEWKAGSKRNYKDASSIQDDSNVVVGV